MGLSCNQIITLMLLEGFGSKTVLKIGNYAEKNGIAIENLNDFLDLVKFVSPGKRSKALQISDLKAAQEKTNRILSINERLGIGTLSYFDSNFPALLKNTVNDAGRLDPPAIVFFKGNIDALCKDSIAIIGTRNASENALNAATFFAAEFVKKEFNIISGLAVGCDTSAHKGALLAGGITTAVLAHGLDTVFPPENARLANEIIENNGILISEYPVGTDVTPYTLVARDRLQASLSMGLIVIQTGINGGSMHAANAAFLSHKPVFAVYYHDVCTSNNENTIGNSLLVKEKKASYISVGDDLTQLFKQISNNKNMSEMAEIENSIIKFEL